MFSTEKAPLTALFGVVNGLANCCPTSSSILNGLKLNEPSPRPRPSPEGPLLLLLLPPPLVLAVLPLECNISPYAGGCNDITGGSLVLSSNGGGAVEGFLIKCIGR